jgi:hypothetical protein
LIEGYDHVMAQSGKDRGFREIVGQAETSLPQHGMMRAILA